MGSNVKSSSAIRIPEKVYVEIRRAADKETRSISSQALRYILIGMKACEKIKTEDQI